MAAGGHFGLPKLTFYRISHHFRSKRNIIFFWFFFYKITSGGHFGWPKITFDRISRHFRWIHNFVFLIFFTKWLPAAILDYRNPLSIAFLTISDQNATLHFFHKIAAGVHFGWSKITLDRIFSPFQINTQLLFFGKFVRKMAAGVHFGWSKITFDSISRHFRSIRNFCFFKMAAGGHFGSPIWTILGWPKITFGRISRHFRLIRNFFVNLFSRWPPTAILEVRFAPKTIGFCHYVLSMAMSNMKLIGEFMTQLETPQAFL